MSQPPYQMIRNEGSITIFHVGSERILLADAIKQYEKVLAINPNHVLAYYNLSGIKKYTMSDDQITKIWDCCYFIYTIFMHC